MILLEKECIPQRINLFGCESLQLVDFLPYLPFLVGRYGTEVGHQRRHETFLTQIFDAQLLYRLHVGRDGSIYLLAESHYLVKHNYFAFEPQIYEFFFTL